MPLLAPVITAVLFDNSIFSLLSDIVKRRVLDTFGCESEMGLSSIPFDMIHSSKSQATYCEARVQYASAWLTLDLVQQAVELVSLGPLRKTL
jgi:hypothetical protein